MLAAAVGDFLSNLFFLTIFALRHLLLGTKKARVWIPLFLPLLFSSSTGDGPRVRRFPGPTRLRPRDAFAELPHLKVAGAGLGR